MFSQQKKLNQIKPNLENIEIYKSLAEKHAKFRYPYLLTVRGIDTSSPPDVFVVMQEYTENLVEYIERSRKARKYLTVSEIITIASSLFDALNFLEEQDLQSNWSKVNTNAHGDIHLRNILICRVHDKKAVMKLGYVEVSDKKSQSQKSHEDDIKKMATVICQLMMLDSRDTREIDVRELHAWLKLNGPLSVRYGAAPHLIQVLRESLNDKPEARPCARAVTMFLPTDSREIKEEKSKPLYMHTHHFCHVDVNGKLLPPVDTSNHDHHTYNWLAVIGHPDQIYPIQMKYINRDHQSDIHNAKTNGLVVVRSIPHREGDVYIAKLSISTAIFISIIYDICSMPKPVIYSAFPIYVSHTRKFSLTILGQRVWSNLLEAMITAEVESTSDEECINAMKSLSPVSKAKTHFNFFATNYLSQRANWHESVRVEAYVNGIAFRIQVIDAKVSGIFPNSANKNLHNVQGRCQKITKFPELTKSNEVAYQVTICVNEERKIYLDVWCLEKHMQTSIDAELDEMRDSIPAVGEYVTAVTWIQGTLPEQVLAAPKASPAVSASLQHSTSTVEMKTDAPPPSSAFSAGTVRSRKSAASDLRVHSSFRAPVSASQSAVPMLIDQEFKYQSKPAHG